MSTIATVTDKTVWQCDICEALTDSKNAFTIPNGWMQVYINRTTNSGTSKKGRFDVCCKNCLIEACKYNLTRLVT